MMIESADLANSKSSSSTGAVMDRPVARSSVPWWRHRVTMAAEALALILAIAWRLLPAVGSIDVPAANLETGTVMRSAFNDYLPVRATVAPRITTLVGALSGGQVVKLLVQDGAMVAADQDLATLANPSLKLDVLTREAQIASQLGDVSGQDLNLERNRLDRAGQIAQANYDLIKARRDLAVRQQLHDAGFVADAGVKSFVEEAEYQKKRLAQLEAGKAREESITATQAARLAETRARLSGSLAAVHAGLDGLIIRAPVAGRLTNFTIQPGQMLKPGDPTGQIDSEGSWKLIADVDEYYLGRVAPGQIATADGGIQARVSRVLPTVTSGHFPIELAFDRAPSAPLNRGQTIDIRVTLGASSKAIVAPVGAWLDAGSGNSVFVIDADGRHARRRTIRIGRRNPEQVEILAGLEPDERIVTSSTASVKGDVLNIR